MRYLPARARIYIQGGGEEVILIYLARGTVSALANFINSAQLLRYMRPQDNKETARAHKVYGKQVTIAHKSADNVYTRLAQERAAIFYALLVCPIERIIRGNNFRSIIRPCTFKLVGALLFLSA